MELTGSEAVTTLPEWRHLLRAFPISLWAILLAGVGVFGGYKLFRLGYDLGRESQRELIEALKDGGARDR